MMTATKQIAADRMKCEETAQELYLCESVKSASPVVHWP